MRGEEKMASCCGANQKPLGVVVSNEKDGNVEEEGGGPSNSKPNTTK